MTPTDTNSRGRSFTPPHKESQLHGNTEHLTTTSQKEADLFRSLRKNPAYYFANLLKIETKAGELSSFDPKPQQKFLIDLIWCLRELRVPVRLVVLKARQIGLSTFGAGITFHSTVLWPHRHSKVVAHDLDTTELLFEKSKMFYNQLPDHPFLKPKLVRDDRKQLVFADPLHSRMTVSTAGTKTAGSGATVMHLHCSEVAKWENPGTVMTSLMQTVPKPSVNPDTTIIIESTANGQGGYFHEHYVSAKEGKEQLMIDLWNAREDREQMLRLLSNFPRKLGWIPIFFPWYDFEEYREDVSDKAWFRSSLSPYEREIKNKYRLTEEQLQFRRTEIDNLQKDERGVPPEELFKQEYPANDEEAFISTGQNYFSQSALQQMTKNPVLFRGNLTDGHMRGMIEGKARDLTYDEWKEKNLDHNGKVSPKMNDDPYGPLKIYEHPKEGEQYVVAGDVAIGERETSDFSCLQVVNKRTGNQAAIWWGRTHPETLAKYGVQLAAYYNEAILGFENNSFGVNCIRTLQNTLYPYPYIKNAARYTTITDAPTDEWGWRTDQLTKPMIIDRMATFIRDRSVNFNCDQTLRECRIFRQDGKNLAAPEGEHDDRVMAMAIALWILTEHPFQPEMRSDAIPLADIRELEKTAQVHSEEYDNEESFETSYA